MGIEAAKKVITVFAEFTLSSGEFQRVGAATEISNYNRANDASGRVCGNRLLKRLMSPSPKSQVMFVSAFS